MADPEFYRTKDEVEHWRSLDPINRFTEAILRGGHLSQKEVDGLKEQVEREVQEAADFAEESPFPQLESLYDNVYANPAGDGSRG